MSQVNQNIGVSPAFQQVPDNPNLRAAERLADNAPAPSTPDVVAPASGTPAQPQPAASPASQPAVVPTPQEVAPVSPQVPPPPAANYQPDWAGIIAQQQRQQQLEAQNAEMQRRLQEQDATIGNLMQLQREYDDLKRQQQLAEEANSIDYSQLGTVDAEDARAISAGVLKAVQSELAPLRQQLQQQQEQMKQYAQYQEQRTVQRQAQETLSRITAEHPDFLALNNDPGFRAFMQQRDGYSSQTLDDRAADEFRRGNHRYINNLVAQYKQARPASGSIAAVAPVQTATAPAAPAGPSEQLPTLHELNSLYQMRQITPEQYKEVLAKIRAAQNT